MHVDQTGQHRLAGGVDRLGVQRFRVRKTSFVDIVDLAVAHQHRAGLDHLAVADKDARILNQPVMSAGALAIENSRLG